MTLGKSRNGTIVSGFDLCLSKKLMKILIE